MPISRACKAEAPNPRPPILALNPQIFGAQLRGLVECGGGVNVGTVGGHIGVVLRSPAHTVP